MAKTPDLSHEPTVAALCVAMMILSVLAVILRVWSRLTSKKQRFWWDDWFAITSLVCVHLINTLQPNQVTDLCEKPLVLATLSLIFLSLSTGFGHPESQVGTEKLALAIKYDYIQAFTYHLGITMPKYSALFFYVRLFGFTGNSGLFKANILIAAVLVTGWLLCAFPLSAFQCTRVWNVWLPLIPGHCYKSYTWFLGVALFSVIIDFYIMLVPLPILWSLHAGRRRKTRLIGFFFCAYW